MSMIAQVCWQAEMIERVLDTEALHVPDALFLATHHPSKMFKKNSLGGTGTTYEEKQFLEDFLKPEEYMFAAVIGEAGTGKSHLVRWLAANIPYTEKRRVLLIPRSGTNLRRILQMILHGLEGQKFDEYRQRLQHAAENTTPEKARETLLSALAISIGPTGRHDWGELSEEQEYFAQHLHYLFHDPFFRNLLLHDNGIIHRLTDHILGQNEKTERLTERREFRVDDLPVNIKTAKDASSLAREVHEALLDPELKEMAVEWINEKLNDAIIQMLNFQGTDLMQLMEDVRAELANQDVELVLLIEDFAVLQGIDMQLLDALLVKPRMTERKLCNLRVALACTNGYYGKLSETVTRRIDFIVDLNVKAKGALLTSDNMIDFVGRYLNVLRLGEARVKEWHEQRAENPDHFEVPSACRVLECPHLESCHAGFGQSKDHGLYPFNRDAIETMYSRLFSKENPEFNPRIMVKEVLRHTLSIYGEQIRTGTFPAPALYDHFGGTQKNRLSAIKTQEIKNRDIKHADRREVLIELWSRSKEVIDLPPIVHEAFQLPMLDPHAERTTEDRGNQQDNGQTGDEGDGTRLDPKMVELQENLEHLDKWKQGGEMPQLLGQKLRDLLYPAINTHIDWDCEFLNQTSAKKIWKKQSIGYLRGTKNNNRFQLQLPLPEDNINNTAIALQAMIQHAVHGHWAFENGPEYFRFFSRYLMRWSQYIVQRLREWEAEPGQFWNPVPTAVEVLTTAHMFQGDLLQSQSADRQMEILLAPLHTPSPSRSKAWVRLQENLKKYHAESRELLIERVGCTKGSSSVYKILDVSKVLPVMRRLLREGTLEASPPEKENADYIPLQRSHAAIRNQLEQAVEEEAKRVGEWLARVKESLGAGTEPIEVVEAVSAAMQQALTAGIWVGPDLQELKTALQRFKSIPLAGLLQQAELCMTDLTVAERVEKLGRLDVKSMELIDQFLLLAKRFLEGTTERTKREINDLMTDPNGQVLSATKTQIEQKLNRMADWLEELRGGGASDDHNTGQNAC